MKLTNEWIVGFVDGDGCFKVLRTPRSEETRELHGNKPRAEGTTRYCFVVSQDKRSKDVLYALKKHFGCGFVNSAGRNMYEYRVANQEHLKNIILPFFVKHGLRTCKREDFKLLYKTLMGVEPDVSAYPTKSPEFPTGTRGMCRDWLIGFIDAEANYYVSMVKDYPRPQFSIGLHERDHQVLYEIKNFLNCGVIYKKNPQPGVPQGRRGSGKNPYITYQISSLPGFEKIIETCVSNKNRCLLRTAKRISFLKFSKIVSIIKTKKHLTPEGKAKIRKIRDSIR